MRIILLFLILVNINASGDLDVSSLPKHFRELHVRIVGDGYLRFLVPTSMDSFAVSLRPGLLDLGTLSVNDSFWVDFASRFQPCKQLDSFVKYCKGLACRPDVSARAVEAQALRWCFIGW